MRITPKMQTALLFCLYLTRAGKSYLYEAIREMDVDDCLCIDTIQELRRCNIVRWFEPVGSGDQAYELIGNPTVADVLKAVSPKPLLTAKEAAAYRLGQHEHRALALLADNLNAALTPLLNRTIRGIGNDLILAELAQMDGAKETGAVN